MTGTAVVGTNKEKTYFHRTPGSTFYMPDGRFFNFNPGDGHYTTNDEAVQKELDKIAGVPSSHVYTKDPVSGIEEKMVLQEIVNQATLASDTLHGTPPGTRTVELPHRGEVKPTLVGGDIAAKLEAAKQQVQTAQGTGSSPTAPKH